MARPTHERPGAHPRPSSKPRQHVLADHVCELVEALTKHRRGSGPHWLMVSEIEAALSAHGVEVDGAELQQAIAIARQRCVLKTEGQPVHSVSRWQQPLGGKLR